MSVFVRTGPKPAATPRKRRLLVRDPDLPKVFLVSLLVSAILGGAVWYIGSARGLGWVEVKEVANILAIVFLITCGIAALARAVMVSDLRLGAVLIATIIGWTGGTAIANRLTPGLVTDGDAAIVGPPRELDQAPATEGPIPTPDPITGARFGGPIECQWNSKHDAVLSFTSRRSFAMADPPPFPGTVAVDLEAGTITVERVRLDSGEVIATFTGTFPPTTASTGSVVVPEFTRTVTAGLDSDTTLLLDLLSDLNGWYLFWDCQRLP